MVIFIAPAFHEPVECRPLIESLIAQTSSKWKLIVYHNGPNDEMETWVDSFKDIRITYRASEHNTGAWGCYNRQDALSRLLEAYYVVQTSIQDVYTPDAVEAILEAPMSDIVYWDSINHLVSGYLDCELAIARIDWGNFATNVPLAQKVGIQYPEAFAADGLFIRDLLADNPTTYKIHKILTTHN